MYNLLYVFYFTLFFLIVSLPKSLMAVKIIILVLILSMHLFKLVSYSKFSIRYAFFYVAFVTISTCWIFIGQINGNSSIAAIDYMRLYVVFFVIYFFIFLGLEKFDYIKMFIDVFCASSIAIFLINLMFFIDAFFGVKILPESIASNLGVGVAINDGYLQSGLSNITSLFFISPILMCLVVFDNGYRRSGKKALTLAALCCFLSVIMSGRRTLIVVMMLSPIFLFIISAGISKFVGKVKPIMTTLIYVLPLSVSIYLFLYYQFDIYSLKERLLGAVTESGQTHRINQFYALLDSFFERPYIGHGFGAVSSIIRSVDRPWSYELSYMTMLFNGGIIGVLSIGSLILSYVFLSLKSIVKFEYRKQEALYIVYGIILFCISNATNPYFSGFDSLYILCFLPLLSSSNRYLNKRL